MASRSDESRVGLSTKTTRPGTRHLTVADLAERMSAPIETVYDWNKKGTGPKYMRVGKRVLYKESDVEAWENSLYVDRARIGVA